MTGPADHARELRTRGMQIVLSMGDLDLHDALTAIAAAEELVRYLHQPPGQNAPIDMTVLERRRS